MLMPVLLLFAGCASERFGSELSVSPSPQPFREQVTTTVRVPQDAPFRIALPRSSRAAGLDGQAVADAQAEPSGQAQASAQVTASGTAEGMFQLGHSVSNQTDRQTDLDFRVSFTYEFQTQVEPDIGRPDATVGLKLYARDQRGRMLREMTLVGHTTESGPTQRQAREDLRFGVSISPGSTVHVFLAGQTRVEILSGGTAAAQLKLSDLRMEITSHPAPAVGATSHESR